MAVATGLVAVMPVLVVWSLRSAGLVPWPWLGLVAAMGLSTIVSAAGCAYWKRREGSGDLLFSELLVWGWLRRWHAERQLADAVRLLAPLNRNGDWRPQRPAGRHEQLLRRVAGALEAEDRYTRGHSARVARYATSIARKMGLPRREIETIRAAAMVHDVGKLRVPLEVLNKPTRLTDAEFALIRRHPVDGAEMVAALQHDDLTAIVRHHHERLDGRGYPDGLAGDEIPIGARIIAVADTFDAITSLRPYRPRRDHKTALDILTREQGTQLDRDAVRAFLVCYSGRRSVAVWSVMTSVFERLAFSLTGQARAATITTGSAAATAVATAAIGAVAMISPTVAHPHQVTERQAVRAATGSPAGSTFATTLVATLLGSAPARPWPPGVTIGPRAGGLRSSPYYRPPAAPPRLRSPR